jgi:hypothetical protein
MLSGTQEHDAKAQFRALQLCLAADKRSLGFFLGAGCPLSVLVDEGADKKPLIPDIRALTALVTAKLDGDRNHKSLLAALAKLCAEDGCKDPNIEDYLNRLRNIQAVGGDSPIRGITPKQAKESDKAICGFIAGEVSKRLPGTDTPYHALARWIRGIPRTAPVEIFTPNYDMLFEEAFEQTGVPYFDGFVGSRRAFLDVETMEKDVLPPRWARLWKLHGSVNWRRDDEGNVWRGEESADEGMLIYPSHEKYTQSRQMPFLTMHDRMKAFLNRPGAVLVVCGYSFVDKHFNILMRDGLRGNSTAVIFALCYGNLSSTHPAIPLAEEAPNFLLLAKDSAVIGGRRRPWKVNADPTEPADCPLGDFAELGKFLASISGQAHIVSTDSSHATGTDLPGNR